MPIANHIPAGAAIAQNVKFLEMPQAGHQQYAADIKKDLNVTARDGDSDHFVTMTGKVEKLATTYTAPGAPADVLDTSVLPEFKKESGTYLRSWFSALLCCMMYGTEGSNDIHIGNDPLVIPGRNRKFLKIWKKKFNKTGGLNSNDGTVRSGAAAALEPDCDKNSFNYITLDPMPGAAAPAIGYHNKVGAFHDQLFVLPLKEYSLSGIAVAVPEWKKKYFYLIDGRAVDGMIDNKPVDPNKPTEPTNSSIWEEYFDRLDELNVKQKIMIHMSARSIGAAAPKPLLLAKALIQKLIKLPTGVTLPAAGAAITPAKDIDGVSFYKTANYIDLDSMIDSTLYLGRQDNEYYATYPLTEDGVTFVKNNGSINDLKLEVDPKTDDPQTVISANVKFTVNTTLVFIGFNGVQNYKHSFDYPKEKSYAAADIKWIRAVPTLCMYPNLKTGHEHRCNRFTYFSRKNATLLNQRVKGLGDAINLETGLLMGDLYGNGNKTQLINYDSNVAPYNNIKAYNDIVISSTKATKPEHFIMVSDRHGETPYGYVLNIKSNNGGDLPALLKAGGEPVNIVIDEDIPLDPANPIKLSAYIDFGSSSSYVRYKINEGEFTGSFVENRCTVRTCLAEYDKPSYKNIINYPTDEAISDPQGQSAHKFLSTASVYNPTTPGVSEFVPYAHAWTPIINSYKDYSGIGHVRTSHKTDIATGGNKPYPRIIIENILYTVACNAVEYACSQVEIVPSLPSYSYLDKLKGTWDNAITDMNHLFTGLTFDLFLHHDNSHFLYESIAIALGQEEPATDALTVNIDMGDGTTDLSAIYVDSDGIINLCGYSSLEYAGKDLIKTVVSDILKQDDDTVDFFMIGSLDGKTATQPIFVPHKNKEDSYKEYVESLKKNRDKSDVFESRVMDILEVADFGGGTAVKDQKVAANFIMRYMLLMPVIKDFIHTAIKIAGPLYNPRASTIEINFRGGAAKGINLFADLDRRGNGSLDLLKDYFVNEFNGSYATGVTVDTDPGDGKRQLIEGLAKIILHGTNLMIQGTSVNPVNWEKDIDPREKIDIFGQEGNVHKYAFDKPGVEFKAIYNAAGKFDTAESSKVNKRIIKDKASYYNDIDNPYEDLKTFYEESIYNKLIDNIDENDDAIELLLMDFVKEADAGMISDFNRELGGFANSSFTKAVGSCVYPEMIKSTIFMFALSRMLSKYQGNYKLKGVITSTGDAITYKFGK